MPSAASAQQPFVYSQRSPTLAGKTLRFDLGPPDFALLDSGWIANGWGLGVLKVDLPPPIDDTFVSFGAGLAYGFTSDFEAGVLFLPLELAPDGRYGDMELYGRYRFVSGTVELAGQLALQIPTDTEFGFGVGMPVLVHLGDSVRLDLGAELEVIFDDDSDDTWVNLDFPLALAINITPQFFLGPRAGFFVWDMDEVSVPVGILGGFTIGNGPPVLDLTTSFTFFLGDPQGRPNWELLFGANIFVDVG